MSTGIINNTIAGMKPKKGIESSTSIESTQTVTASSCSDTNEIKQRPLGGSNDDDDDDDESITESPRRKKIKPMTEDDEASVEDDENENDSNDENSVDSTADPKDNENNNSGSDDNEHEDDDNDSENSDDNNNESDDNEEEEDEFHAIDRNNDSDREDDEDDDDNLLELLRRAAAAQGIPFELLVRQAIETHGADDDEDESREYPFGTKLPTSLDEIANFILSDKCRNILVLAGAGMSVSAGTYIYKYSKGMATFERIAILLDRIL